MNSSELFWQTYLNLEKELLEVAKYIYVTDEITILSEGKLNTIPCSTQLSTFSPYIADLLIRTCIEIEAISKELYFRYGGEKGRDTKDLYFDTDCLKLIDIKCKTSKKVIEIACPLFNLKDENNSHFRPLRKAHERQGADWERAYQAVKHDRYSSISQGTVKNLLHAMGALYLLNIYYRNIRMLQKYSEVHNLDFSFGSSIFSVTRPDEKYINCIINNQDVTDVLESGDSPFVIKYTDDDYKRILAANETALGELNKYWQSQPELQEEAFIQQLNDAKDKECKDPTQKVFYLEELARYRLRKEIPDSLPFEERKKRLISLPEWEWMKKGDGSILDEKEITEANIQELIDQVGIRNGFKQEAQFKSASVHFALERYCEVVLDTGDIRYKK